MFRRKTLLSTALLTCLYAFSSAPAMAQSAFDDPQAASSTQTRSERGQGQGALVAVEPTINAGDITVGSNAQVIALFRNDSNEDILFRDLDLYPSSNITASIGQNACSREALPPGAECAVIISLKGSRTGSFRLSLLGRHSGAKRLVSATVVGSVLPSADDNQAEPVILTDFEIIPSSIDFGSLNSSRPIIRSVTIKNISPITLDIKDIRIDSSSQSGFSMKHNCTTLEQGEACIASVTWAPLIEGPASGFLVVEHSGPGKLANVALSGNYSASKPVEASVFPSAIPGKGLLISDITEFNFGSGVDALSALTATLVNIGDSSLRINDISLAGAENGISLSSKGCADNTVLEPTEACALTLRWSPTREGDLIDNVQIRHSGARGVFVMPIKGSASAAVSLNSRSLLSGTPITASSDGVSVDSNDLDQELQNLRPADLPPLPTGSYDDGSRYSIEQKAPILDSYILSSHATDRAVISGPNGSRIITDGKHSIIGGIRWLINITPEGAEFISGKDKVLLLFDDSLSINTREGQSSESLTSTNSGITAIQPIDESQSTEAVPDPLLTN